MAAGYGAKGAREFFGSNSYNQQTVEYPVDVQQDMRHCNYSFQEILGLAREVPAYDVRTL